MPEVTLSHDKLQGWLTALVCVDSALGTGPCEKVEKCCAWCSEGYRYAAQELAELRAELRGVLGALSHV